MKTVASALFVLALLARTEGQDAPTSRDGAVASTVDGKQITLAEVDARLGSKLLKLRVEEYSLRRKVLQEMIDETLIAAEAGRRRVSVDALMKESLGSSDPTALEGQMSDDEVDGILRLFPERYQAMSRDAAAADVRKKLAAQRFDSKRQQLTRALRSKFPVAITLAVPRIDVSTANRPVLGPGDADVSVVVFSDFQCPYCAKIAPTLKAIIDEYPGRVRLVFKYFPLPSHREAVPAARAAACADAQGRFWEYHDRLFEKHQELTGPLMFSIADSLGLEGGRFERCFQSAESGRRVQEDVAEGRDLGISGTPTVFVNGRMVPGVRDAISTAVSEEIDERARQRPSAARK